jgi:plastocyanin
MKRVRMSLVALPVVLLLASFVCSSTASAATTLTGTVGPGFTISLKKKGKTVKSLKAGTYKFRVSDKADIHNFHLRGPGVNKVITSVDFKGTKTVTIKLKKGTYRYVCDPHSSSMHGSFKVR